MKTDIQNDRWYKCAGRQKSESPIIKAQQDIVVPSLHNTAYDISLINRTYDALAKSGLQMVATTDGSAQSSCDSYAGNIELFTGGRDLQDFVTGAHEANP